MIKYLSNGIEVNGEFISKETLVKEIESVKVKERDLVVVRISWSGNRNFDGCYENIVLPRELANEYVDNFTGREAYFGEIAGKHSEIYGTVDEDEIEITHDAVEFLEQCPRGRYYDHSFVSAFYNDLEGRDYEDVEKEEINRLFDILERVKGFRI